MTDAIMGEMVEELMVFARQGVGSGEVEVNLRSVIADTVDQCKGTFDRPGIPAGGSGCAGTSESSQREARSTSGTILIIDDEKLVRSSTARLLELVGYSVLEAEGGVEGLVIFEAERSSIDLVLLDLPMPHMRGMETLARIRRIDPDARVVIITGHLSGEDLIEGAAAIVHKPYKVQDLTSAIREAVSG